MKYRPEIDGLRALAVLPVILFHAGFEWFSGGFVGVDVFFVISGYLITTIIISEMAEGKFSIVNFYERRARRILPALFLVMFVCLPFGWLWLSSIALKDFGQSLIAVSTFSSNILFWFKSGYFDPAAELKPLLHTWSLAVEEQYYILFPIFLMVTWKLGIKWISWILILVFIASLGIAQWGSYSSPSAAFYLLPARGWELLIGVIVAIYLKYNTFLKSQIINQILSLTGFSMILYSIVFFDETTPFPSAYTLIPTLGTGLLILSAVPNTFISNLLSLKPIVGVGLISYSAYLWHQPILAFARIRVLGEISELFLIFLCFLSLAAGWLSWRFIEKPFRDKRKTSRKQIFIFSLSGILIFSFLGSIFQLDSVRNNVPSKLESIKYASLQEKINTVGEVCDPEDIYQKQSYRYCFIGSKSSNKSVVIFGDSHVQSIQYELNKMLINQNIKGIWIKNILVNENRCVSTIFTINKSLTHVDDFLKCGASYSNALDDFSDAEYLILLNRWSFKYFFPESSLGTPYFKNKELNCIERNMSYRSYIPFDDNGWKYANDETMAKAIYDLLHLSSSKLRTILVYPIPEIGCDPYKYNLNHRRKMGSELDSLYFPVSEYDDRNKFVIDIFNDFQKKNIDSVIPIKPRHKFCNNLEDESCTIIENYIPLYIDDDHLSNNGAKLIVDEIKDKIAL